MTDKQRNRLETERTKDMSPTAEKSSTRTGLDALLTPQNSVLILIDHQAFQFANLRNLDPTLVLSNTIGLAKGARAFGVPTILDRCPGPRRMPAKGTGECFPRPETN